MANDWRQVYQEKKIALDQVATLFNPGDHILVGHTGAYPRSVMNEVVQRQDLTGMVVSHSYVAGRLEYLEDRNSERFFHHSLMIGPTTRGAFAEKKADYEPAFFYTFAATPALAKGDYTYDKIILHLSPPDEYGNFSYGICCSYLPMSMRESKVVIAQINENMPTVFGKTIHISEIDYIVEAADPLVAIPAVPSSEVERKIGSYVAELIEDGSTLQIGIGGIPNAVLSFLEDKKDLGIHSEMISDGVLNLVEKGVVTNSKKSLHPGKMIVTFILGSDRLYQFVNKNPMVEAHPGEYTNDPCVICKNSKFVSINAALQIDLTGQINAESIGTRQISGTGGHLDFAYGALKAPGGKSIIAVESTASEGKHSRIVPFFAPGTAVTTPRTMIDYVATEHGYVKLKGKTLRERAKALISIAHPQFRDELTEQAKKMWGI